jgi:hypothetical protein
MSGLRVNFTDKEASSTGRSAELMPRGDYHVVCSDGEEKECGPEAKNAGKPYWNLEFTIQSGPYAERKLFTNCMLFDGALYTLAQILKCMGLNVEDGELEVPTLEEVIGFQAIAGVYQKAKTADYDARNEISGFRPVSPAELAKLTKAASTTSTRKGGSLLPKG